MTQSAHMRIDVGGGLQTAVDVYRPAEVAERPVVAFGFPHAQLRADARPSVAPAPRLGETLREAK